MRKDDEQDADEEVDSNADEEAGGSYGKNEQESGVSSEGSTCTTGGRVGTSSMNERDSDDDENIYYDLNIFEDLDIL